MLSWINRVVSAEEEKSALAKVAKKLGFTHCRFVKELNREIGEAIRKPERVLVMSGCPFDFYMTYQTGFETIVKDLPVLLEGLSAHMEHCKKCQYLICYVGLVQKQENGGAE